ncbi:MAG: ASKHA domain-containing protein [Verrucomicrobiota bacterium]
MSQRNLITLQPDHGEHVAIHAESSVRTLSDILAAHGFPLNTRCGQRGLCRGCEVVLREGSVMVEGARVHSPATLRACRTRLDGPITLGLPSRSRIEHKPQVGETFEIAVPCGHDPLFTTDGIRDTGFAVDIGTTTVVVLLVDLTTGEVISRAGGFNGQIRFGDNVLTRIDAARTPEAIAAMKSAIVGETLAPLMLDACQRAGRGPERIAGGSIAGNTTMLHLLVGEDPTSLGIAPFTARFLAGKRVSTGDLGLTVENLPANTPIQLLPGIGAYIGADITAGIYATGMVFDTEPSLLVDIGTNGEIVLQSGGVLTACATAAGPAFEGCGLRGGTRAREGAVSDLRLCLEPFAVTAETIGNIPIEKASGICGSAYIDFLASARDCGLLTQTGRFAATAWTSIPAGHRCTDDDERALRLAGTGHSGEPCVSEVDVAVLLQAKAAIGAGIETLLETAGIRATEIHRVYLAGGFGMHLNVPNAIAIGLLPEFRPEQVRVVGNTSLAGALLALIDRTTLDEMESIRERVDVIELNLAEGFEDRYIEHLMLP